MWLWWTQTNHSNFTQSHNDTNYGQGVVWIQINVIHFTCWLVQWVVKKLHNWWLVAVSHPQRICVLYFSHPTPYLLSYYKTHSCSYSYRIAFIKINSVIMFPEAFDPSCLDQWQKLSCVCVCDLSSSSSPVWPRDPLRSVLRWRVCCARRKAQKLTMWNIAATASTTTTKWWDGLKATNRHPRTKHCETLLLSWGGPHILKVLFGLETMLTFSFGVLQQKKLRSSENTSSSFSHARRLSSSPPQDKHHHHRPRKVSVSAECKTLPVFTHLRR